VQPLRFAVHNNDIVAQFVGDTRPGWSERNHCAAQIAGEAPPRNGGNLCSYLLALPAKM
jgi:hypothetical protein